MGVIIALVCFLVIIILATTDEAEVLPPVDEDESAKKEVDDAAQMYKNVDKVQLYREGYGEFWFGQFCKSLNIYDTTEIPVIYTHTYTFVFFIS